MEFLEKKRIEAQPVKPVKKPVVLKKVLKKKNSKLIVIAKKAIPAKKIKIVLQNNPQMIENKEKLNKYITFSKCQHKTGVLSLVKDTVPNAIDPSALLVTPIFVALNKNNLSFFLSTKSISLFNIIKLDNILRITQRFSNSFCFDIIENDVKNLALLTGPVTLCASNILELKQWIDAIEEFKECQVNINPMLNNKRVIADFQKINTLLTDKMNKQAPNTKKLYYDNVKAYKPSEKRIANEIKISNQLKNIINVIKLGNFAQNSMRRRMINKLKTAEQFAIDIRTKQQMVQDIIRKRLEEEKESETKLITIEHKAKEYRLLKAVEERIKKMKVIYFFMLMIS